MWTIHHQFLLYSFLLLLNLATISATTEKCNPEDRKTLVKILKYYNFSIPTTDCCDWPFVSCDSTTNRITSFSAFGVGTPGPIKALTPAIGHLTHLTILDIRKLPSLTEPIPSTLSKLTHLEFLRLDSNALTGPIPNFLHTLTNLSYINLSFNNLSGSIPPSIALGPSLDYLRLDRNRLTGSIPETFGSIKNGEIFSLMLSHNQLSGPIPSSMGNLSVSYILDLSRNMLTGDASFLFAKKVYMDLSRNQLEFDFSKVEVPSQGQSLSLQHNKIFGSLPTLTELQLHNINVSYNRLCGKIPSGGGLGMLNKYDFFHNKCLCGAPLDACK